ncbi:MAG: response regulator transcription factor [Prevotella sp.]|nr:response regulator transcription factor [Prevotella sp.]
MNPKILVVDDEQDLCDILRFNLEAEGYEVLTSTSGEEALAIISRQHADGSPFHLLLLDVMMPGMSGFELAQQLRGQVPVIFLTAKDTEDDVLRGFHLGADDYIAKPFSLKQVLARVKAVLARTAGKDTATAGLALNDETKEAIVDGRPVALTRTEFALLSLLLTERGRVFSRQELLELVWPEDVIVTDRTVDVNITRLRKKIGPYARHIATRQGFGYYYKD